VYGGSKNGRKKRKEKKKKLGEPGESRPCQTTGSAAGRKSMTHSHVTFRPFWNKNNIV
jgi:hypothetical protein